MDSERLAKWSEAHLTRLQDLLSQDRLAQLRRMELAGSQEEFRKEQGVTRYLSKQIETINAVLTRLQRGERKDGRSGRTGY
jgi:hypothetical protein